MALAEFQQPELGKNLEQNHLIEIDPTELVRDNPAASIVNKETYQAFERNFQPIMFQEPHVVRVRTYSPSHGMVIKLFVVDGLTRVKYLYDNPSKIALLPAGKLLVQDVTEADMQDTLIVPQEERNGYLALTMLQYLRAVVPKTIEHAEIAPERISAHLINGWENMVGLNIAEKFSALSVICFLTDPLVPIATDRDLRNYLNRYDRFIYEESLDERAAIDNNLIKIAQIIRQAKLLTRRGRLAEAAFDLIMSQSVTIGGERQSYKEIFGMLRSPLVQKKLEEAFPYPGQREEVGMKQLGGYLVRVAERFKAAPNRNEIGEILAKALQDPTFLFNHIRDVAESESPTDRYYELKKEINYNRLERIYLEVAKLRELSEAEQALLNNLGRVSYLSNEVLLPITRAIIQAKSIITGAQALRETLLALRAAFERDSKTVTSDGVTLKTVEKLLSAVTLNPNYVPSAQTLKALSDRINETRSALRKAEEALDQDKASYQMQIIIDQFAGDRFQQGYGPVIQYDVIRWALMDFKKVDQSNIANVERVIRQLLSLDDDILVEVVRPPYIRLQTAMQRQAQRKVASAQLPQASVQTTTITPVEPPKPPVPIETPLSPEEQVVISRQQIEQIRIESHRRLIRRLTEDYIEGLNRVDLDPKELTTVETEVIDRMLRMVGKWVYPEHPNIPGVIEEHKEMLAKKIMQTQQQIQQNIKDDTQSTKTGI